MGVDMRRFASGIHQQDPSKDLQRDPEHVLGILAVEKLRICCDKLVGLFGNDYLRFDVKNNVLLRYIA